jgi:hypothetical protein
MNDRQTVCPKAPSAEIGVSWKKRVFLFPTHLSSLATPRNLQAAKKKETRETKKAS